uniref:Delta-1 n=1 Tax=Schmidtea mediterranea TaxID=79327 RepID=I1ZI65_SCHMD|nr:delta-1 [Schmidtea mediterranea]
MKLFFVLMLVVIICKKSSQFENSEIEIKLKYYNENFKSIQFQIIFPQKKKNITYSQNKTSNNDILTEETKIKFDYNLTDYFIFKDNGNNVFYVNISDNYFLRDEKNVYVELVYSVKCAKNHYGRKCAIICQPLQNCVDCSLNGEIIRLLEYCKTEACVRHINRTSEVKCPKSVSSNTKRKSTLTSTATVSIARILAATGAANSERKDQSNLNVIELIKLSIGLSIFSLIFVFVFSLSICCYLRQKPSAIHEGLLRRSSHV